MNCPECGQSMFRISHEKPINWAADIKQERWRCNGCRLFADIETTFWHDESADAVTGNEG